MVLLEIGVAECFMWLFFGLLFAAVVLVAARFIFVVHVQAHEIGFEYNYKTGKLTVFDRSGYFFIRPFVTAVNKIDCRPMQVKFESDGRVCCLKDVCFKRNPEGVIQFIKIKGRKSYDMYALPEIMRSFVFEGCADEDKVYSPKAIEEKYKFLEIIPTVKHPSPDCDTN